MFSASSCSVLWSALYSGSNPLIRDSDRRLARCAATLLALALLAVPLVAVYGVTYHAGLVESSSEQLAARSKVTAVLLDEPPADTRPTAVSLRTPRRATATASWSTRDGVNHEGRIPVPSDAKAGDEVAIWIDSTGTRVNAPMTASQAVATAVLAAVTVWLVVLATLGGIYLYRRARLVRARYTEWEHEWRELDEHRA